ncbi:type II DNA modification methyltransferase, partial [Listeria monocytogenes]|nr:type II DNA modification methyltransferase [Listeria monocytogenes]
DWAFDRAAEVNSNSQLYKQSGNSVTENVIWKIAKLFKEEKA